MPRSSEMTCSGELNRNCFKEISQNYLVIIQLHKGW